MGLIKHEPDVIDVRSSCSPVETGYIADGGWNWSYPAIAKVAGTAGNLERWAIGYEDLWQDINDPSKEERTFRWMSDVESYDSASEWLERF